MVLVPGNHETYQANNPSRRSMIGNAALLVNEGIEIDALRILGSPITARGSGAFCVRSAEERRRIYDTIPNGIDILITHGPGFGVMDAAPGRA
jgi:hypothetical protein